MALQERLDLFGAYDAWLFVIGLAFLAAAALPRLLSERPLSMPLALFGLGFVLVALPTGLRAPDPLQQGGLTERLTELGVIIALMGAGLKIDRPPSWHGWGITWRLLGITMVLTIALTALVGWHIAALAPATALLLGAVIAPTDPVLASEVMVGAPGAGSENAELEETHPEEVAEEDEVRFALTSEAGLNDGLAFPFTNLAVAAALYGVAPRTWLGEWFLVDVLYKLGVAVVAGIVLGYLLGTLIIKIRAKTPVAHAMTGIAAIAGTLLIYGATQFIGGYGFISVFIGAIVMRHHRGEHEYHVPLFLATEQVERLLAAGIILAFGAAVAGGLLAPLDWPLALAALVIFFLVRPVTGILGLLGARRATWPERLFISFFGIRGIGSLFYLAFALNKAPFPGAARLWALVGLVVVLSVVLHGVAAAPLTTYLDRLREETGQDGPAEPQGGPTRTRGAAKHATPRARPGARK